MHVSFSDQPRGRSVDNFKGKFGKQVAVVGLSCRLQAEEMLEKRLRSRFSNSWKFVAAASIADFESAEESPVAVLREMLTLEPAEIPDAAPDFVSEFNAGSKAAVADPSLTAALRLLCEKGKYSWLCMRSLTPW